MKRSMTLPRLPFPLPTLSWASRGPMASWLLVGNLLMIVALAAMTALSLWNHRETETDRARDVVENLAQNIAVEVGAELRNTDNALATIALRYRSTRQSADQAAMVARLLDEQRGLLPQVVALRVTDLHGTRPVVTAP